MNSWLLDRLPPGHENLARGEARLWWDVLRVAAKDLRYGHTSIALDALEFFRDGAGVWLLQYVFGVDTYKSRREVVSLVRLNPALRKYADKVLQTAEEGGSPWSADLCAAGAARKCTVGGR